MLRRRGHFPKRRCVHVVQFCFNIFELFPRLGAMMRKLPASKKKYVHMAGNIFLNYIGGLLSASSNCSALRVLGAMVRKMSISKQGESHGRILFLRLRKYSKLYFRHNLWRISWWNDRRSKRKITYALACQTNVWGDLDEMTVFQNVKSRMPWYFKHNYGGAFAKQNTMLSSCLKNCNPPKLFYHWGSAD